MDPIVKNTYVSWKTSLAGVLGFALVAGHDAVQLLSDPRIVDWKTFFSGFFILLIGLFSRDGDKSSESTGANPSTGSGQAAPAAAPVATAVKAALLLIGVCLLLALSGCATDSRVTAALDGAQKREQNAIDNHNKIHQVEQQALQNAQNADIEFRRKLNVNAAVQIATTNKAVTPAQLAADIERSNLEAQQMRDAAAANIANLQQQIAAINQDHVAAQQILTVVQQYNTTPDVTATGVATAAVQALTPSLIKGNSKAAVVPDATPAPTAGTPTTTAAPVPGQ